MQFTLTDLWHHMGLFARLIVAVLGVMSVASLVVMAERLIVFNRSRSESRNFAEKMANTLAKNDLATVGSTAPFVGLLGTVMGIVNAFQSMALTGSGGLGTVSAGIAEALITTAFGLLVAIPAVMAYNYLQGWVDARAVDISESSNEFLDLVAKQVGGHTTYSPG